MNWPMTFRGRRLGRAGNVAILTALAMVPLLGMVALAVDFGQASMVKAELDLAADAAALVAVTAASNAWNAHDANPVQEATAAAQARFQAQSASQPNVTIGAVNVSLTQTGVLFNVTVTYAAQTPTSFASVLGITTLPIGGQASASLSLNPYVDIQVLMDASSSMTLAATADAMTAMAALATTFKATRNEKVPGNVSTTCTLACHWSATDLDYYKLAVTSVPPVQLRITVLQAAVGGLINTLLSLDTDSRFRLGLYTFNQQLNTVYALSQDVAGAAASVPNIAPDVNFCTNDKTCPDTYFSKSMAQLTALALPPAPQGNVVPQRFLFLVSDGVYDQYVSGQRQIGAFNPTDCAALKAMGASILVLYTPYTAPVPSNSYYVQHVEPVSAEIVPNLQACASSPSYFFVANDATDINNQLQNMLQLVVQTSSHLTN
jgi:Flp pilus assembly protein TadG